MRMARLHPVGVAGPGEEGVDDLGRAFLGRSDPCGVAASVEQERWVGGALAKLDHPADRSR